MQLFQDLVELFASEEVFLHRTRFSVEVDQVIVATAQLLLTKHGLPKNRPPIHERILRHCPCIGCEGAAENSR